MKEHLAGSQHYRELLCQILLMNDASRIVFWQRRPVSVRRAKAICFFQYPTANIYLTTSWRVQRRNRGLRKARLSGSCAFISYGCWWLLQFWWWQRRQNQIKQPFQLCTRSTDKKNIFSKLVESLWHNFKEQQRPGPGRGNLGGGTRVETRNNGGDSLTGDHGGGEEVWKRSRLFIYFFPGF